MTTRIELRVVLEHGADLSPSEAHALAIDTLAQEFHVADDLGITEISDVSDTSKKEE